MRYVQLRAFHHVAVTGGFSRAAEALHLTQPAISDQVRRLEQDYDVLLFVRHHRRVELTAEGRKLLSITHRLFECEAQAVEHLSESRALRTGVLRIIADSAIHLTGLLAPYRARFPGVRVSLRSGNSDDVVAALYSYGADVGVLGVVPTERALSVVPLNSTPIVAFAARSSAWGGMAELDLCEAGALPLVMREAGSRTRAKVEEAARARGIVLTPAIEAEGREAVRELVASGAGIGFVSAAEFGADARIVQIPLAGPPILMDEALVCLQERAEVRRIRAFMALARG